MGSQRIAIPTSRILYVAIVLLVVFPAIAFFTFEPALHDLWCERFDIPEYERQFGFRLGTFEVPSTGGGTHQTTGIASVEADGPFGKAGVQPGDLPRMHHGIKSLCAELAAAAEGDRAELSVVNVADVRQGKYDRREVTVRLRGR